MIGSSPGEARPEPLRAGGSFWPALLIAAVMLVGAGVGVGVLIVGGKRAAVLTGQGTTLRKPVDASPAAAAPTTPSSSSPSSSSGAAPTDFATIYARQRSGVVRIEVLGCTDRGIGTGFLLAPRLVATVDHVVAGSLVVSLIDGHQHTTGQVLGTDPTDDLALVRTAQPIAGYHFRFAGIPPQVGEDVAAIGFPIGGPITLTQGGVSGLHRTITVEGQQRSDMIQTDAAVNPGNSGGPLLTGDGKVIGLVDALDTSANGIAFAVPASEAEPEMRQWSSAAIPAPPADCANPLGPRQARPRVRPPAGLGHTAAHRIATTLATYFAGINSGDYQRAYNTFSPTVRGRISEPTFATGDSTSYDFDQTVLAAHQISSYRADVALSFTSLQASNKGPNGDTCDVWTLTYHMIQGPGARWYINGTSPYGATDHTTC